MLIDLDTFVTKQVLEEDLPPSEAKMEAFADAITAIEYFLDSLNGQSAGAEEALQLARESISHLRN